MLIEKVNPDSASQEIGQTLCVSYKAEKQFPDPLLFSLWEKQKGKSYFYIVKQVVPLGWAMNVVPYIVRNHQSKKKDTECEQEQMTGEKVTQATH